jgi:hypothetical protein
LNIHREVANHSPSTDIERQLRELHDYYALQRGGAARGRDTSHRDETTRPTEEHRTHGA